MKLILRLWHAKLAFHPLSPKKKHSINAHYAETWGLFEIASLFVVLVCAFVCAPPPSARSFLGFIPSSPDLDSGAPTSRMHVCTPAPPPISIFCLHPSPLYPNSLFINTQGVNISPNTIPFTYPSPSLSQFSPTAYGKVPLFPTLPPYFSLHSPYLANCKIRHRAGEGIFLKAFTPYALIYCALRPTGEEVKRKNEKHLTRAREENPKNTPASPCRLSPRPNIRLPHVAATFFFLSYSFPLLRHEAQSRCGEERKCMYAHFSAAQRGTRPRFFDTKHNK